MIRIRNLIGVVALQILLLLLNSQAVQAQWHFPVIPGPSPNAASSLGNDCVLLTPQNQNVRGVVWDSTQIDISQPFDISLSVMVGPAASGFGADGLALVLQNQGLNAYGAGGNGLGYSAAVPPDANYGNISPSIAFELDTWNNSGVGVADHANQHVAIHRNGIITSALAGPTPALTNGGNINDSICRTYRVVWNPSTNNVRIFYPTPTTLRINATIDIINTVFSGTTNVWWGFTGSSGNPGQTQVVCVGAQFANAGPDTATCPGQPLQLNASGGVQYFWGQGFPIINNQNIPNPTFNSLIPLPYYLSVLVTNIAGCQDRDSVTVTVEPFPNALTGTPGTVCLGDSVQLGGNPNNNYAYQWTPGTNLSNPNAAMPWVTPITPGTISYQLLVVDTSGMAGCADSASVSVVATDTPSVSMTALPDTICQGSSTMLVANASGGSGNYTFAWSPGGATTSTVTVSPMSTTTYTVTVTDVSLCATVGTLTVVVLDSPVVTAAANPTLICAGQTTTLSAQASGGVSPYTFAWSNGQNGATVTANPQSTTDFIVSVTDANGCVGTAMTHVDVNVSDSIDILTPDTFVCNNGAIAIANTFGTPGVNTWTWSPSTGVSNPGSPNPVISPNVSTTYQLSGFNSLTGCGYVDSIRIDVFDLNLSIWPDTTICLGDTLLLDLQISGGSGNYFTQWLSSSQGYISDDSTQNPMVSPNGTTQYTALVTDTTTGCTGTVTTLVNVTQLQVQATPGGITINPGQSVQMQAFGAMFYLWSPDTMINCITCQNPVAAPSSSTIYTVLGWDTTGCRGTATVNIVADSLLVPNVFSPNGDGVNDVLFFNYYGTAFYQISVYDRWGNRIFSTTDKNAMWDGKTAGGADAPESVYYVAVRIVGDEAIPDKDKQRVFAVTLLR